MRERVPVLTGEGSARPRVSGRHRCALAAALYLAGSPVRPGLAQALPVASPADVGLSPAALARIAPAMQSYIDAGKLSGIVVAIARHGRLAYLQAFGFMDLARRTPMPADAIFRILSLTKPVTAVAVMQLYDRGLLRLDDPVTRYVPAFRKVKVYDAGPADHPSLRSPDRAITIQDLLTHTAGLTYGGFGETTVDSIYRRARLLGPGQSLEEFADSVARLPLLFSPGTAWNYSVAFDVLGRVVEVVSGQPYDQFLDEELFRPLAMGETTFHARPGMAARAPTLYVQGRDGGLHPVSVSLDGGYRPDSRMVAGGHGLLSTVGDYLRFSQMLLNGGELNGRRILKQTTAALMMANHLPSSLIPIVPEWLHQSGYGQAFGGAVLVDSAAAAPEAPGAAGIYRWTGYASTYCWIDPHADLTGIVWSQLLLAGGGYPLDLEVQRIVYSGITTQ